jgi:L-aminopeptidase/D-esterase-like protein
MTKILNQEAFDKARDEYAQIMGFTKADGSVKPISKLAEEALEAAIVKFLVETNQMSWNSIK